MEAELVEQYGGCAALGGTLTNWIPGGETTPSMQLGFQFDDGGWSAAYEAARRFKEFPRGEEEVLAGCLNCPASVGTGISAIVSYSHPREGYDGETTASTGYRGGENRHCQTSPRGQGGRVEPLR